MKIMEPKRRGTASRSRSPLSRRAAQQRAIAEFGSFALEETELQSILDKAVSLVCETLETDICKALQLQPDGKSLLLVSGCGIRKGLLGKAVVPTGTNSQAGYTLKARKLIVVEDLREETRFQGQALLIDLGVVSGMTAPLYSDFGTWGVLGSHTTRKHRFSSSEIDFFQSVANVLSVAIRRAEQDRALIESDQNLRAALEVASIGTFRLDSKTRVVTCDANLNSILGFEAVDASLPLDEVLSSVHPEDRPMLDEKLAEALESKKLTEVQCRIVRTGGAVRWAQARGRILAERYLTGVVLDITEHRQASQDLARLAAIVESSQDAIISATFDGVVTSWNPGAEKVFGYTATEMIGQPLAMLLPKDRKDELAGVYGRLRHGERVEAFESLRVCKDGRVIPVSVSVSGVRGENGQIIGASAIVRDLTRRKQTEVALTEHASQLRLALEAGRMGTWEWDIKSGKIYWSPNLEDIHGVPRGSFNGTYEAFVEGIHAADREVVLGKIKETIESNVPYQIEYRLANETWVEGRGQVFLDRSGKPARMIGICADITERKRGERALRESEERFRQLADAAPALIWLADAERRCTYFNKGWLSFRGRTPEEEAGYGWLSGVHPEDRDSAVEDYKKASERKQPLHQTYRLLRHDGEYRCVFCQAVPRFERDGRFVGYIGSAIDITDIRRAEEALRGQAALRASEMRFREIADAMPHMVWEARPDGFFDYFNKRWHDYTGIDLTEGSMEIWSSIVHPDDWPRCLAIWRDIMGKIVPCETVCRFKNIATGEYRWHLTRALPIRDDAGNVIRWIGSATDIHGQKQAEEALAEAKEELRKRAEGLETAVSERTEELRDSLKTMETLLYTIAHDLRAPLRAMQGLTAAVVDDYGFRLDEDGREYLNRIDAAARRMDHLIADLLAYGRIGHIELPLTQLELEIYVDSALAELVDDITAAKAEIIVRRPLPTVKANPTALTQVLRNLLTNAIKFVAPRVTPRIEIDAEDRGETVRVSVRDNGIGIDPMHQERIFQVFQRLHTTEAYAGTGIGLAIVSKAIQRMDGKVGVESECGKGSRFWFELSK